MLEPTSKTPQLFYPILLTCIFILLLNNLYRHPLYQMGILIIKSFQASQNLLLNIIFLTVTMIIDPSVVFVICVLMLILTRNKAKGLVMILFILVNTFCAAVLKAYDSDPRPIWTDRQVRNIGFYCPVEYGNPSGHSWFSAIFGFGILLNYKGVAISACILMPISRMYLGAHSINQVLQGLLLGLGMCILYHVKIKQIILRYLTQFGRNKNMWLGVIAAMHLVYLVPFIAHRKEELPAEWQANILTKCAVVMNQQKLNSIMLLANALFVSLITGIGYGYQILVNSQAGGYYLKGDWQINQQKYEYFKGYCMLILVEVGCLAVGMVIAGVVYFLVPVLVVRFFGVCVGGFVSGYVYTSRSCAMLTKYKIIRETVV